MIYLKLLYNKPIHKLKKKIVYHLITKKCNNYFYKIHHKMYKSHYLNDYTMYYMSLRSIGTEHSDVKFFLLKSILLMLMLNIYKNLWFQY